MTRRGEWFAAARAAAWTAFAVYVITLNPALKQSIFVIFILSVYANIESAYSSYSAKRAERCGLEQQETSLRMKRQRTVVKTALTTASSTNHRNEH